MRWNGLYDDAYDVHVDDVHRSNERYNLMVKEWEIPNHNIFEFVCFIIKLNRNL